MFITIYLLFSPYKPIDLLLGVIFYTVACIPGELENLCTKKMNLVRVQHVPSLFQVWKEQFVFSLRIIYIKLFISSILECIRV